MSITKALPFVFAVLLGLSSATGCIAYYRHGDTFLHLWWWCLVAHLFLAGGVAFAYQYTSHHYKKVLIYGGLLVFAFYSSQLSCILATIAAQGTFVG